MSERVHIIRSSLVFALLLIPTPLGSTCLGLPLSSRPLVSSATQLAEYANGTQLVLRSVRLSSAVLDELSRLITRGYDIELEDCHLDGPLVLGVGEPTKIQPSVLSIPSNLSVAARKRLLGDLDIHTYELLSGDISVKTTHIPSISTTHSVLFAGNVRFTDCTIQRADLGGAQFLRSVSFEESRFGEQVTFASCTFYARADFRGVEFLDSVAFNFAHFGSSANFPYAHFGRRVDFDHCTFDSRFGAFWATFDGDANFGNAAFAGAAEFRRATFNNSVSFIESTFSEIQDRDRPKTALHRRGNVNFTRVVFRGSCRFDFSEFRGSAFFDSSFFAGDVSFNHVKLGTRLGFADARCAGDLELNGSQLSQHTELDLSGAVFERLLLGLRLSAPSCSEPAEAGNRKPSNDKVAWQVILLGTHYTELHGLRWNALKEALERGQNETLNLAQREGHLDVLRRLARNFARFGTGTDGSESYAYYRGKELECSFSILDWVIYVTTDFGARPFRILWWWAACIILPWPVYCLGSASVKASHEGEQFADFWAWARSQLEGRTRTRFSGALAALWFSLNVFTPAIEVFNVGQWIPSGELIHVRCVRVPLRYSTLATMQRLLGWILVPIGIAGFAGLFGF